MISGQALVEAGEAGDRIVTNQLAGPLKPKMIITSDPGLRNEICYRLFVENWPVLNVLRELFC